MPEAEGPVSLPPPEAAAPPLTPYLAPSPLWRLVVPALAVSVFVIFLCVVVPLGQYISGFYTNFRSSMRPHVSPSFQSPQGPYGPPPYGPPQPAFSPRP